MQVLNLSERIFHVSEGVLRPQEIIELPEKEALRLNEMFKGEIKILQIKENIKNEEVGEDIKKVTKKRNKKK